MPDCTGGSDFALFNFTLAFPCRGAIGGDDGFAALEGLGNDKALEGLGNDKAEVLGEGRKNEDVTPVPDFLELIAKGATDNAKVYWTLIIICGIRWRKFIISLQVASRRRDSQEVSRRRGITNSQSQIEAGEYDLRGCRCDSPLGKLGDRRNLARLHRRIRLCTFQLYLVFRSGKSPGVPLSF